MKATENKKYTHSIVSLRLSAMEDEESTVSYFDDYFSEVANTNMTAYQRRSFASSTSNDDDSTASTVPSTIHDDQSFTWNDDIYDCFDYIPESYEYKSNDRRVKRVTFGDATIREYGLTVAACTPANTGRCPMELTWEYAESYSVSSHQDASMMNGKHKTRPLTVLERRERIAEVQGISNDEVRILEYEASIALIRETLEYLESSRHNFLYSTESPSIRNNGFSDDFSYQNKPAIGESNQFLRKIIVEEISFNPL
jgi:hypothetical protein